MQWIDRLRSKWQEWSGEEETPFDGDAPAWAVTFLAHLVALVVLGFVFLTPKNNQVNLVMKIDRTEELEEIVVPEEVYFDVDPSEQVGANSDAGEQAAQAMATTLAEESIVTETFEAVANPTVNVEVSIDVSTAPVLSDSMNVRGSPVGSGTTGASGAVDRITYEILQSLEQRKTLVVWCFDSTLSLKNQRTEISGRFSKIYEELGILENAGNEAFKKHDDQPLLSSAVAYGSQMKLMTEEPTADVKVLKEQVAKIEADNTGDENSFSCVRAVVQKFASYRTEKNRNVMIVLVTDEVGSDSRTAVVEETIALTRRYQMPVYVVGVPAPFGRQQIPFRYVSDDPQFAETEYWLPVDQGPESRYPELVRLAFWGDVKDEEMELIDSGFGPYQLTRLCYESGGIYFSVHPNRNREARAQGRGGRGQTPKNSTLLYHFWDPAIMRPYQPEYVTEAEYLKLVAQNKARWALLSAAKNTEVGAMENPITRFVKADEGALSTLALEAQKQSAKLEPKLRAIYDFLKQGEADRPKLTGPRWQAGFDLAIGRTMAAIVRTEGYNAMIAEIKAGKAFKEPKNNTWVLVNSDNVLTGSSAAKMADTAKVYLQRVVKDHEGTPWAFLAQKELETPMGWEWKEEFTDVSPEKMGAGNGTAAPEVDSKTMLKKKPNAPKPKI